MAASAAPEAYRPPTTEDLREPPGASTGSIAA